MFTRDTDSDCSQSEKKTHLLITFTLSHLLEAFIQSKLYGEAIFQSTLQQRT